MGYTNSPLVTYTNLTQSHSGLRNHSIDRITPHCIVGQWTAKRGCDFFAYERHDASCNYVLGTNGDVGLCVEEKNRSWCSSSAANDNRAVTIECASDLSEPYAFNNTVYNRLIELCADICKRNGKTKLLWLGSLAKTEAYAPKSDEMILTVHRWFAPDKSCPGNWLMARMDDLAAKVTAKLNGDIPTPEPTPTPDPKPSGKTCKVNAEMPILERNPAIKSTYVKIAQQMLISKNYSCGGCGDDGYFGNGTLQAVRNFREENNLPDSDVIDSEFWNKLLSV